MRSTKELCINALLVAAKAEACMPSQGEGLTRG